MATRCILHVDMDAFYASVEQRDDPNLRGHPVVVGGGGKRSVVAAASYEARKFGIRSAMPMSEARSRCSSLLRVPLRMSHYKAISGQIFDVFRDFTPLVEGLSLDEAFLDVSESLRLFGSGEEIAIEIKNRIEDITGLTASVGVAENKLVAKIASDLDKPDGLFIVNAKDVERVLGPLPVSVIPGIGRKTLARLHEVDIHTVSDLRQAESRVIEPIFGRLTHKTQQKAAGIDDRPVVSSRTEKSISAEETYEKDLSDLNHMEREILRLSERVASRLRKAALQAGTINVKIRQSDFRTFTRQRSLRPPGNATDRIYGTARDLLAYWLGENPDARIRLLGVGGSGLTSADQGDLFMSEASTASMDNTANMAKVADSAVDEIRERFGADSVGRASTLPE